MKIYFARHGQTTGDVEDRYGGDYNDHLSEEGKQQSEELARELVCVGIEEIIVSPLNRAQETARVLSNAIGVTIRVENGFKERNQYGILTGMIKSEARAKYHDLAEKLKDRLNTIEGAESYEDFSARIQNVFSRTISDQSRSCIAIVTHGGPLRVLFRDILKNGELAEIGDCAWVELDYQNGILSLGASRRLKTLI